MMSQFYYFSRHFIFNMCLTGLVMMDVKACVMGSLTTRMSSLSACVTVTSVQKVENLSVKFWPLQLLGRTIFL